MTTDYLAVTELSGDEVAREQIERIAHRYTWVAGYCRGKDVIEAASGTGQGLLFGRHRPKSAGTEKAKTGRFLFRVFRGWIKDLCDAN